MKNEKFKTFPISRIGFSALSEFDHELLEKARTVVMWYLEASYGRNSENQLTALVEAATWTGFKVSTEGNNILYEVGGLSSDDYVFYTTLLSKFQKSIETLKIDEHDELGLMDETIQIANLMLKYRYIIALRRAKKIVPLKRKAKNLFDRVLSVFE